MSGPLAGVRVLDLSQIVAGPMAAGWLCDQGADVVKVETPLGDPLRGLGPLKHDLSATYIAINKGKRHLMLDLKQADAAPLLAALIAKADVLVENFRPGVLDKLGFGWAQARAANPRLIYCSITGYGPDGPYAGLRAYDPMIQASSGIAATQLSPDGEPQLIQTLVIDKVTALTAAQAITAALFARERSGEGQRIEIAMLDAALAFNWPEGMYNHSFVDEPPPVQPAYGRHSRLWRTKDGKSVVLGSFQDREFAALCDAIRRPEWKDDARFNTGRARARNVALWETMVSATLAELTSAEFMTGCIAHGAGGAVVNALCDVPANPQIVHNRSIAEIDQPGAGRVRVARHPARFSATPTAPPRPVGPRDQADSAAAGW